MDRIRFAGNFDSVALAELGRSAAMRQQHIIQATIFENFAEYEIGRELRAMSQWLDQHHELVGLVMNDLHSCAVRATGREGLSAETVLRCALSKQYRQLSYEFK